MRYRELLREAHPDIMLMYHGTNTSSAQEIVASGGFDPTPQDRSYDGQENPYLESYPGTYFTDSLANAVKYAQRSALEFAAEPAIVIAKVPLHQAVPDEDLINIAVGDALKKSSSANGFISTLHRLLVQDRPIPMANRNLLLTLRRLYRAYETSEGTEHAEEYRSTLDKVAHAYAKMVFDTHPVYLGGTHTVRLPQGLPLSNVVSITSFYLTGDSKTGPSVTDVHADYGDKGLDQRVLQQAVNELIEQGWNP